MKGYFRKRGNSWSFTVDIGKDPITGERRQKTKSGFRTKKEAQAACAELIAEIESDRYIEPKKIKYKTFLENWLKGKKLSVRNSTFSTYESHVRVHIIPFLGELYIPDITSEVLTNFYLHLAEEKGLSRRTIRDIHRIIHNSLEDAVEKVIRKNPAKNAKFPKSERREIQVWTRDESKKFLEEAKNSRYYIAFLLAVTTGMRQGEILGLRWQDIDFSKQTISVVQTLDHSGKNLNTRTKTAAGSRIIAIDQTTAKELEEHKSRIERERQTAGQSYHDNNLVVCTSNGTPCTPRNLYRTFQKFIEKTGVRRIAFHDLRHTHASHLLEMGVHPKVVSERLGHANIRITLDTYSHLLPNMQHDVANQFGHIFFQDNPEKQNVVSE